jgi:hypothetical protein
MANYFRITAYHPTENLSVIMDSNGMFEKLWQFSSFMVSKGFKIIEVGGEDKFDEGDMPKAERDTVHIILRACSQGKPTNTASTKNGIAYKAIAVKNKMYIPDTTIMV